MRDHLSSGSATRLAALATALCTLSSPVLAWDEDRVASQIQPYFGGWAGAYTVNTDDLYEAVGDKDKKILGDGYFSPVCPAVGLSLGVAYSRVHLGLNVGYQVMNGNSSGRETAMKNAGLYTKYDYQVIPVDLNLDVALLRNEAPVNLLLGGSAGIGLVGIRNPYSALQRMEGTTRVVTAYYNDWNYTNAILATGYIGARINLARRLNLEGQLGWRVLSSDEMEVGDGVVVGRTDEVKIDSANKQTETQEPIPLNLSGAYFRADIRWTFASQTERDEERAADRVRAVREAMAEAVLRQARVASAR